MRQALKQFKNIDVIVTGRVEHVMYRSRLNKGKRRVKNVRILLKDVMIAGQHYDHIWLYERNNYFNYATQLKGHNVKFKAKVVPYLKRSGDVYKEDYGIERQSRLLKANVYEQEKPFKKIGR